MKPIIGFSGFAYAMVTMSVSAQEIPAGYKMMGKTTGTFIVACETGKPPESAECKYFPVPQSAAVPASQPAIPDEGAVDSAKKVATQQPKNPENDPAPERVASTAAHATEPQNAFEKTAQLTQFDLAVPASPAFATLGLSPEKVQRPGAARDLAASLVRSIGPDGKLVNGVAIDISPASVFFRKQIIGGLLYSNPAERDANPENWGKRVLARTTVSVGTVEGDKSGSSKIAVGLRVGIWDEGDPGLYVQELVDCLRKAERPKTIGGLNVESVSAPKIASCHPNANENLALWAKPALYAGIGKYWYSDTGRVTSQTAGATNFWLTYSQGLVSRNSAGFVEKDGVRTLAQLYLARRIDDRFTKEERPNELLKQNSTEAIIRLRSGRPTWHGYIELGRRRAKTEGVETENVRHLALGAEFKLSIGDDIWLQLAQVRERGFFDGTVKNAITGNIRFGVPFLATPGPSD